jgi:hypothetical protein
VSEWAFPCKLGRLSFKTPTELAYKAAAFVLNRVSPTQSYSLMLDHAGAVWIDKTEDADEREIVATFKRRVDPLWLADELTYAAAGMPK